MGENETRNIWNIQKNKMVDLNLVMSIITLYGNGLNTSAKGRSCQFIRLYKKVILYYLFPKRTDFKLMLHWS